MLETKTEFEQWRAGLARPEEVWVGWKDGSLTNALDEFPSAGPAVWFCRDETEEGAKQAWYKRNAQ